MVDVWVGETVSHTCNLYGLTVPPPDRWMSMGYLWNDYKQGKVNAIRKPVWCHFVHHKSHMDCPGDEPKQEGSKKLPTLWHNHKIPKKTQCTKYDPSYQRIHNTRMCQPVFRHVRKVPKSA
jgi:hypothetical protein